MNWTNIVQTDGPLAGWVVRSLFPRYVFLALLATNLMSCAHQAPLRYMYLHDEVLDTEWGYPGSEARIDVTNRVAVSASTKLESENGLLRTDVTLTNVSKEQMGLLYRGCPVQIQIFRNDARTGEPLFDSFGAPDHECPVRQVSRTLFAREDLHITLLTRLQDVLPDVESNERYYVTAVVRPNGIRMDVPAGEIQLVSEGVDS